MRVGSVCEFYRGYYSPIKNFKKKLAYFLIGFVNTMTIAFKFALIGALVAATSAFSSNRRNGENDEIEENEKHILNSNNFNRLFIIIESLMPESTTTSPPLETPTDPPEESSSEEDFDEKDPDPLSVVWYLGAFGGLIAFFLVVTFSEWCCASKHLYRRQVLQGPYISTFSDGVNCAPQTPPPPYHLFAPPPYEVVSSDKTQFPILIVPIHKPTNPEQG